MSKPLIVLVPGMFDLVHVGHTRLLYNAKQLAGPDGRVIVACSSDECAIREKKIHPIHPFEQRMELLRAIKYVDLVIRQDTLDKSKLIKRIQPDFMVAGDDWEKGLKGQEALEKIGGKVIFFPRTRFISTSELIEKIKAKGSDIP